MGPLQIFIQREGARDIHVLEVSEHATVRDLVEAVRARGAAAPAAHASVDDGAALGVYAEEHDEALPMSATLAAAGLGRDSSVHVSRCRRVGVVVQYNGAERARFFGPGAPMHRVKRWAVGKQGFDLTPVDAAEHLLQVAGTTDRPDEDVHAGALVTNRCCAVTFDLVAKVRVEGRWAAPR